MFYRHGDVLFERVEAIPEMHNPRTTDDEKNGIEACPIYGGG